MLVIVSTRGNVVIILEFQSEIQMAAEFFKFLEKFHRKSSPENQLNLPYDFIKQIHLEHQ
jgi:hypothetical protein